MNLLKLGFGYFFSVMIFLVVAAGTQVNAQKSESGILIIKSQPTGALIILDDKIAGRTDKVISGLAEGEHAVVLKMKNFKKVVKNISVMSGDTVVLEETLIMLYPISISSSPSGGDVYIDGQFIGITPIDTVLNKSSAQIKVSKKYHLSENRKVELISRKNAIRFNLEPKMYDVLIKTYPRKAGVILGPNIYQNGETLSLTGGDGDISVGKKGYNSFTGVLTVKDVDGVQTHRYLLEPKQYRTKKMALLYSLACPGMGHRYLRRSGYGSSLGVVGYGLLLGSVGLHNKAANTYDQYLIEIDAIKREQLNAQWQDEKRTSQMLMYGAGVIWVGGIIWTLIIPDEVKYINNIKTNYYFDNVTRSGLVGLIIPIGRK